MLTGKFGSETSLNHTDRKIRVVVDAYFMHIFNTIDQWTLEEPMDPTFLMIVHTYIRCHSTCDLYGVHSNTSHVDNLHSVLTRITV